MSTKARAWTQEKFNFDKFVQSWDELFMQMNEEYGSWDDRTGYTPYEMRVL